MKRINIPIIGLPNVGKSSLLNLLVGEKVSIVTPKPHTTRSIQYSLKSFRDLEVVFVDTPGIDKVNDKLGSVIFKNMQSFLKSLDRMMLVVDATNPRLHSFLPYLEKSIVILNKIDYVRKPKLLPLIKELQDLNVQKIFCVSAKTGDGVKDILDFLKSEALLSEELPDHALLLNSQSDILQFACECVREKILLLFQQEVPYKVFIKLKEYMLPSNSAWTIMLDIIVPRESYKPIIIGKKCERLKKIGQAVRLEVGLKLQQSGFLGLNVVVDENLWEREETYNSLGWSL